MFSPQKPERPRADDMGGRREAKRLLEGAGMLLMFNLRTTLDGIGFEKIDELGC
jgi:hypothetical protein